MNCKFCGEKLDGGFFGFFSKCVNPLCSKDKISDKKTVIQKQIPSIKNREKPVKCIDNDTISARNKSNTIHIPYVPLTCVSDAPSSLSEAVSGVYVPISNSLLNPTQNAIITYLKNKIESNLRFIMNIQIKSFHFSENFDNFNRDVNISYDTSKRKNNNVSIKIEKDKIDFYYTYDLDIDLINHVVTEICREIAKKENLLYEFNKISENKESLQFYY